MLCAVLCCAVLCCAVLCCAVLCCAVLCCAVLCCAVLCCALLCCAVLCCAVLCCAVRLCSVPHRLKRLWKYDKKSPHKVFMKKWRFWKKPPSNSEPRTKNRALGIGCVCVFVVRYSVEQAKVSTVKLPRTLSKVKSSIRGDYPMEYLKGKTNISKFD